MLPTEPVSTLADAREEENRRTMSTLIRPCRVATYIRVRSLSPGKGLMFPESVDGMARSRVMCPWRVWKDALSSL